MLGFEDHVGNVVELVEGGGLKGGVHAGIEDGLEGIFEQLGELVTVDGSDNGVPVHVIDAARQPDHGVMVTVVGLPVDIGGGVAQGLVVGLENHALEGLLDLAEQDAIAAADEIVAADSVSIDVDCEEANVVLGQPLDFVGGHTVNEDLGCFYAHEDLGDLLVSDNGSGGGEGGSSVHVVYTLSAGGVSSAFSNKTHVWACYCVGVKLFFVYPCVGASRARVDWGVCLCPVCFRVVPRSGSPCRGWCHMDGCRTGAGRREWSGKTLNVWPRCHQNQGGWVSSNDFGFNVEASCITYNPLAT